MNKTTHPYFVPNGDNRRDTAILLVGTAEEHDIDQREVRAVNGGFRISQAVADAVGLDTDEVEDEQVDPDSEGERTSDDAASDPESPVEAETPVEVAPDEDAPSKGKSSTSKRKAPAKKAPANRDSTTTETSGNRAGENRE